MIPENVHRAILAKDTLALSRFGRNGANVRRSKLMMAKLKAMANTVQPELAKAQHLYQDSFPFLKSSQVKLAPGIMDRIKTAQLAFNRAINAVGHYGSAQTLSAAPDLAPETTADTAQAAADSAASGLDLAAASGSVVGRFAPQLGSMFPAIGSTVGQIAPYATAVAYGADAARTMHDPSGAVDRANKGLQPYTKEQWPAQILNNAAFGMSRPATAFAGLTSASRNLGSAVGDMVSAKLDSGSIQERLNRRQSNMPKSKVQPKPQLQSQPAPLAAKSASNTQALVQPSPGLAKQAGSKLRSLLRIGENGIVSIGKTRIGHALMGTDAPSQLISVGLEKPFRGLGLGRKIHVEMAKVAPGRVLHSHTDLTQDSVKVWKSLARRFPGSVTKVGPTTTAKAISGPDRLVYDFSTLVDLPSAMKPKAYGDAHIFEFKLPNKMAVKKASTRLMREVGKMWKQNPKKALKLMRELIPEGVTRALGKQHTFGSGTEGTVFQVYTGGKGLRASKVLKKMIHIPDNPTIYNFPETLSLGTSEFASKLKEHVKLLKSRPDVFPQIDKQHNAGYIMERLKPTSLYAYGNDRAVDNLRARMGDGVIALGKKSPLRFGAFDIRAPGYWNPQGHNVMKRKGGQLVASDPVFARLYTPEQSALSQVRRNGGYAEPDLLKKTRDEIERLRFDVPKSRPGIPDAIYESGLTSVKQAVTGTPDPDLAKAQARLATLLKHNVRYNIGGSFGLRHLRAPHDLDVDVHKDDFDKAVKVLNATVSKPELGEGRMGTVDGNVPITFFDTPYPEGFGYDPNEKYDEDEYGNKVNSLARTLAWKHKVGRTKDLADIAMVNATESNVKQAVTGIPDLNNYGDTARGLTKGDLVEYVLQHHSTLRRPNHPHYDLRLGKPDTGLYSWAVPKARMPDVGEKLLAPQTQVHSYGYRDFTGDIGRGYGAGKVTMADRGQALITRSSDNVLGFTLAHAKVPVRYRLIRIKKKEDGKADWLLSGVNIGKGTQGIGAKPKLKLIKSEDLDGAISHASNVQAKIDGAHTIYQFGPKGEAEAYSYRRSVSGEPIVHTERLGLGGLKIPELSNTELRGEAYGVRNKKPLKFNEVSGILNSGLAKAILTQKNRGITMLNAPFQVVTRRGEPVSQDPQIQIEALKDIMDSLPKDSFRLPDTVEPSKAREMLSEIEKGEHSQTSEGIVLNTDDGKLKYKIRPESSLKVRGSFPGLTGTRTTGGLIVGEDSGPDIRVGTGFSASELKDIAGNINQYIGRRARIGHQGQFGSGLLRAPSYLGMED